MERSSHRPERSNRIVQKFVVSSSMPSWDTSHLGDLNNGYLDDGLSARATPGITFGKPLPSSLSFMKLSRPCTM